MGELLLELFSEEIPARMQVRAAADLKRLVTDDLAKAGLDFSDARACATPRRLVLAVEGLPDRQPDVSEERRGPQVGAPDKAVEGFLKSTGLTLEQCQRREIKGKTFYFAVIEKKGRATAEVLAALLPAALARFPWPKSMRWGDGALRWVRPLHGIVCLFDGAVVPFEFGPVRSGGETRGHRFMAPEPLAISSFADYEAKLRAARVMLDSAERRDVILTGARGLAEAEGLALIEDGGLLDEVAGLVEWPAVLMGGIDEAYMDLPPEVLTTSMRNHQKYFSLRGGDGNLAARFILVANLEATDGGRQIVAGNEKVLRARLHDAKFFWDQDRRRTLESRVPELDRLVFHAKLGSVGDKVVRLQALVGELAWHVPGVDMAHGERAALLAKADLVTGMVGEFPELQGVVGRYYALHEGAVDAVADAIAEHYAPQGPNDRCPTAPLSVAVALADKIDTLVGFFAIGETPTGSKDPFALRRAALGVIRLVLENRLRVPLLKVLDAAYRLYEKGLGWEKEEEAEGGLPVSKRVLDFFADRLKVHLREQGVRHDHIDAVFALGGEDDLVRLLARVEALSGFLATDDGAGLLVAYRRAANILRIEEKKDGASYDGDADAGLLVQDEERELHARLAAAAADAARAVRNEDFAAAMAAMATLRPPVDAFFDHVTVNCDDPALRVNRLRLLSRIRTALGGVADFSRIEG